MQTIQVTYRTEIPDHMTDEQVLAWLQFALEERGELPLDNPRCCEGPEPNCGTIGFVRLETE